MENSGASYYKILWRFRKILLFFYGLLQDNLQPNKFGRDITLKNILLVEIGSHLLSFFSKSECKLHENPLNTP